MRSERACSTPEGRLVRIPSPQAARIRFEILIDPSLLVLHHECILLYTHITCDAGTCSVHIQGLLAEVGAGIGRAGVVGCKDRQSHLVVHARVLPALHKPNVSRAKHAVGGGEEVGAQAGHGGEGRFNSGHELRWHSSRCRRLIQ